MARHIGRMRALLDERGLDAVLVRSKTMKRWMGTLTGGGCSVVVAREGAWLLLDGRYVAEAEGAERDLTLRVLPSQSGGATLDELGAMAREHGWRRVGLEGDETLATTYLRVSKLVEEPVLLDDDMARMRMVKTPEEVARLRHAIDVTDQIFDKVAHSLAPGITEDEVSARLQYEAISRGAEKMAFDTIVAAGERTAFPHGRPAGRVLRQGDHVMIDFGIQLDGFQSDMTRIVFLGEPDPRIMGIYRVVREAQQAGVDAIRSGVDSEDVDRAARSVIEGAGYGPRFSHGLGHGVGVDCGTELPLLRPGAHFTLAEGMVMSCEPGVYVPGLGGVRIEDDVLIEHGVGVPLNHTTKEPIVL